MVEVVLLFAFAIKKKQFLIEKILYGKNNRTRHFLNLARKIFGAKRRFGQENDSEYIIYLADIYLCYMKTSILLKPSILLLWYHPRI